MAGYEGRGYGDLKKETAEAVVEYVTPIKNRSTSCSPTRPSSNRCWLPVPSAEQVAFKTLQRVNDRLGLLPRLR